MELIRARIRDIPDFPKPGILFRDLTPLLADGEAFHLATEALAAQAGEFDLIAGIEARGFVFGAAVAHRTRRGLILIRKPGKLPAETIGFDYGLEYGRDRLELHRHDLPAGARVLLVDDVLATGGTAEAAIRLVTSAGAKVTRALFVVELADLGGASRLTVPHISLVRL
ncbi:MAG: adenine phosphoribosyltransferase [Sphingomonadaceae bacterium]|uniref:adenine phosphoribosyltransferase n=1 Tax=Thermaurantiacus sp. TaxID=2820283 RepID=UPI00298EF471|nr:adenine phosphoribosyltransferase [Thermaurantiacus sp.]MCS6986804.1 adenine phosphoribosyltransferase [Sphingomonadaceae bacterium]MDW8413933.1 adenine phosphoribosyltransferase [Thermaurantiacus sp.]